MLLFCGVPCAQVGAPGNPRPRLKGPPRGTRAARLKALPPIHGYLNRRYFLAYKTQISSFPGNAFLLTFIRFNLVLPKYTNFTE